MKSTSDIMVKSSGTKWKQIEPHVDRTQSYYSNQNVNVSMPGKNEYNHLEDYHKLMTAQFLPYLNAYNHKCLKQRKKNRMYGKMKKNGKGYRKHQDPVSDYLRHTKRRNERMTIFYLGNKITRRNYWNVLERKYGKNPAEIRNIENHALVNVAKIWNKENPYLKVTDYATNTDESTAHIHTRMVVANLYGKPRDMATAKEKRNGIHHFVRKPSMSFNKALTATYPCAVNSHGRVDNREAMRTMRKKFDPVIIKSFNRELAKNGIGLRLSLNRTGKVNHFNLKEYQAKKDMKKPYQKLAKQIKSAEPKLKKGSGYATNEDYYDLATGRNYINFANGSKASGAKILGITTQQSLANQKSKITSSYRSEAVSEAQPVINHQIAENTSEAQKSASLSASSSANSAVSKAKSVISANASASASQAVSKVQNSLNSQRIRFEKNKKEYQKFLTQQLMLAMPEATELKGSHYMQEVVNPDSKHSIKVDGKYRKGLDLITHAVAQNIHNQRNQANTKTIENNFKDYEKNTKKTPRHSGKGNGGLQP